MENFSEELISKILMYLDVKDFSSSSQVCRKWYNASCDPIVTKHFKKKIIIFKHKKYISNIKNSLLYFNNYHNF